MNGKSWADWAGKRLAVSPRFDLWIKLEGVRKLPDAHHLCLEFGAADRRWATAEWSAPDNSDPLEVAIGDAEVRLRSIGQFGRTRWELRLTGDENEPIITAVEMSHGPAAAWTIDLNGDTMHTYGSGGARSVPVDDARLRLGAFSQHGQLFDIRDWVMVKNGDTCSGLIALKPGSWSHPEVNLLSAQGHGRTLRISLPRPAQRIVRSFLLAHAPATQALALRREGIFYFEPPDGYTLWPAAQIARHGFTRPEKIAALEKTVPQDVPAATFPYGSVDDLQRMLAQCQMTPELAGDHPFWQGDFVAARKYVFDTFTFAIKSLQTAAYLHPWGNPVALRNIAPAIMTYGMLDVRGELSPDNRRDGAKQIAVLTTLLFSRDFYPHHVATIPLGEPGSVQSIYLGMLNQNFNTDRYATVGLAGCVLAWHPHAKRWLAHAMQQLENQLTAYLYPGGAWEESHTYANHVKICLLPLVAAARRLPGGKDWTTDARFREFCRFFVQLLSPPDALLDGSRGIPAIGDHGYRRPEHRSNAFGGQLFGCLASVMKDDRELFRWAWRQCGSGLTDNKHDQIRVFAPIFLSELVASAKHASSTPALPESNVLPGYGAFWRRDLGTKNESLLLVRCGDSWGHYHPDMGSFWWWHDRRLLCADADLGDGKLKFKHTGHNVVGYPGREPMQYLDRHPYRIEKCEKLLDGTQRIQCRVRCYSWCIGIQQGQPIPEPDRPEVVRVFDWLPNGSLRIVDTSIRAPDQVITWTLHVPAENAIGDWKNRQVIFELPDRERLIVRLPQVPIETELRKLEATWLLTCHYPEGTLEHRLEHQRS